MKMALRIGVLLSRALMIPVARQAPAAMERLAESLCLVQHPSPLDATLRHTLPPRMLRSADVVDEIHFRGLVHHSRHQPGRTGVPWLAVRSLQPVGGWGCGAFAGRQ